MKKGKVHPSPPPHPLPPSSSSSKDNSLSVFKLLPAAILVLVSVLSSQDQEVLAYLITTSLSTTVSGKNKRTHHKAPLLDCGCFDCYTSYWSRWDSSPNRELIHQIIEAFEDHPTTSDSPSASHKSKRNRNRAKKKGKSEEEPIAKITEPLKLTVVSDKAGAETEKSRRNIVTGQNKGLARKVLPDVLGLFSSRFLSLWNPNP
ncbi:PREDICTED: uncharacterized protein LOC104741334 [Camelina sativa]|uniref:Uncharacterized protein LOC104741334 n=1 Tax=Camelina sativa TaxID=90675 RepID=A0ABM0VSH6_CAMSA|nr:PREDICTED: uncharacterized protein LOC104741334 [Camelina sativa]